MMPVSSHGPVDAEPIIVEIDGVGELEFPQGTDPSVIQAKVRELTAGNEPPPAPDAFSDTMDTALKSKGVDTLTSQQREGNKRMSEGILGGGVMTAAPGAAAGGLKVVQGLAKRLYGGLLKPSKAIKQEFGDVVPGLMANRRLITRGGAEAAETAVEESAKAADNMIASTPRPSQGVSARRVVSEFRPVREAVKARVDAGVASPGELNRIAERARRIRSTARNAGGRIDPVRAQTLKRTSQDAAEGAYRQMERGNSKMLGTDDLLDAATAKGFKGGIEDIVPGIGARNLTTQKLIGETRAMSDAVGRTSNHLPFGSVSDLAAMTAGAGNPLLGVAGKAATMAGPGSAMAIIANELGKHGLDDAMQRALMVAMSQGSHPQ